MSATREGLRTVGVARAVTAVSISVCAFTHHVAYRLVKPALSLACEPT
jgi:hypothetical protein